MRGWSALLCVGELVGHVGPRMRGWSLGSGGRAAPAATASGGGAGRLGAHVVADAGHDVAEVPEVVVVQGVEEEPTGDVDVPGQDAVDEGPALGRAADEGSPFVLRRGASGDEPGLLQRSGLVGEAAATVDDAVGAERGAWSSSARLPR